MKFRPQVQLRFRDEAQFSLVRDSAKASQLSVNEWILRRLENGDVHQLRGSALVETQVQNREMQAVRTGSEKESSGAGQPPRTPPIGTLEEEDNRPKCPDCGKVLIENRRLKKRMCVCNYQEPLR